MDAQTGDITRLLTELKNGKSQAVEQLMPLVYTEMRKMARRYLSRERRDHTLQPTALVHEAYLKLVGCPGQWQDRSHFFAVAAQVMRRILIDHARAYRAQKRGGDAGRISLDALDVLTRQQYPQLIILDQVLSRLQSFDPRQGKIVELRFFGGLTEEEISEIIGISVRTVKRDWKVARAWLYREMTK